MTTKERKALTANNIADWVKGELLGRADVPITDIAKIEDPAPHTLTFMSSSRYSTFLQPELSRTILVPQDFEVLPMLKATVIRVPDVYEALAIVLEKWSACPGQEWVIDPLSFMDPSARIDKQVAVGKFSTVGSHVTVHTGTTIENNVTIGSHVRIGRDCHIHSGVRIYDGSQLGDRVVVLANAVIGADGFGFALKDGQYHRIPHVGIVVLEDDVEIGCNTCIDRASVGSTIIRKGAKLDNLIQVAHSADIGENVAIAAQAGISGSSKIGDGSQLGGQSGVAGHVVIPPKSRIQAQAGIPSNLSAPGQKWYGSPVMPYYDFLRSFSWFKKLPALVRRIEALEWRIKKP